MRDFSESYFLFERRQQAFGDNGSLYDCCFERDNGKVSQISYAKGYVQQWSQMKQRNLGLLFWGKPGNGKTFAAACIANAFLTCEDPFAPSVIMTTFGTILRRLLALSPQDKELYLKKLLECDLLILDDFGMERQTEYAREQIFNIVDGRYLGGRPIIVTTNLTLQQLKNPESMAEQRIFDRILELCVPVCFTGESLRAEKGAEKLRQFQLLTQNLSQ